MTRTADFSGARFGSILPPEVQIVPGQYIPLAVQAGGLSGSVTIECVRFDPRTRWAEFAIRPGDVATLALLFAGPTAERLH